MGQMGRANSMGNMAMQSYMPQMGPVPGLPAPFTPAEQSQMAAQQQIAQLIQMQTQMMHQMMAMQSGQVPNMMPMDPNAMGNGGFLAPPGQLNRPMSMASNSPSMAGQGRSMTMTNLPSQWDPNMNNMMPRASTMSSNLNLPYAGSVYGMNLGPTPHQGYTPSIAPSERSNIGMPSRYRPVSTMDAANGAPDPASGRTKSMSSTMFASQQPMSAPPPMPLSNTTGNAVKTPKSTIRVIEKPKGAPKSSQLRNAAAEDEDDEEGWAELAKKRQQKKRHRATRTQSTEPALSEIYQGYE